MVRDRARNDGGDDDEEGGKIPAQVGTRDGRNLSTPERRTFMCAKV